MDIGKIIANKGVKRNKKPLKNKVYKFEICNLKQNTDLELYEKYKFKNLGYISMYWGYEGDEFLYWHGFVTAQQVKDRIGEKQYSKFCQGKRDFIIQRRINKNNT